MIEFLIMTISFFSFCMSAMALATQKRTFKEVRSFNERSLGTFEAETTILSLNK
jgi:hypothetical protein